MPAVRKPTVVLEARGSFKAQPSRVRKDEPDTGRGVGPAPDYLTEEQRAIWDEIVSDCAPGVFQSSDRLALKALTLLEADFRADPGEFGGRRLGVMLTLWARFGMTPSDRSRVSVRGQDQKAKTGLASFR